MKEELTREVVEAITKCSGTEYSKCENCPAIKICDSTSKAIRKRLAKQLLEEMDKPKVWDGAPEWATIGRACWTDKKHGEAWSIIYRRKPPKTRIDEIIDESLDGWLFGMRVEKSEMREILKSALNKYADEIT